MATPVEDVKARLDIVDYIRKSVPELKRAGRYWKAPCPFHNEKTPSFVVNPDTQSWRCFGACAEGGDVFNFVMKQQGVDFGEALKILAAEVGVDLRRESPQQRAHEEAQERLRALNKAAAEIYHQQLFVQDAAATATLRYVREKRGLSDETLREFLIGYAPSSWDYILTALQGLGYSESDILEAGLASRNDKGRVFDKFRRRLMIPIRDERGRTIGFGSRALDANDNPKYMNSPQTPVFDKSHTLFALDKAKNVIRETNQVVLVEGYMDAIQAHQAGYRNVVAQMGTALTEAQLKLIVPRYTNRIIMALDSDAAGQTATRRSLETARATLQADYAGKLMADIRMLHLPDAKDPDDLLRENPHQWQGILDAALPLADYIIQMETAHLTTHSSIQTRQEIARDLLPLLIASEDNVYRRDNIQKLALALRIPEEDLLNWVQDLQRQQTARPNPTPARPAERPKAPPKPAPAPMSNDDEPPFDTWGDTAPPDEWYTAEPPSEFFEPTLAPNPLPNTAPKPAALPALPMRDSHRAAEAFCLRMLLHKPELIQEANKQFREIALDQPDLWQDALGILNTDDFSQSDYREIWRIWQQSLQQDELPPVDHFFANLSPSLEPSLDALLVDETIQTKQRLANRFTAQLEAVQRDLERRKRPVGVTPSMILERLLTIRRQRLQREQNEMRFLLDEARRSQEIDTEKAYFAKLQPSLRALHLIDQALKKRML